MQVGLVGVVVGVLAMLVWACSVWWETRVALAANRYARECGDEDPIEIGWPEMPVRVDVQAFLRRPCVPRFETYRDWTLGIEDDYTTCQ